MTASPRAQRLAAAGVASFLVATAAVAQPAPVRAVDPQVCTTAPAPTPQTRPWREFAAQPNPLPPVLLELAVAAADAERAVGGLGAASTQEEVESVHDAVFTRIRSVYDALAFRVDGDLRDHYGRLRNQLDLLDPTHGMSDEDHAGVDAVYDGLTTDVEPRMDALTADGSAYDAWEQAVRDRIVFPLSGPVTLPSSAAVAASISEVAAVVDAWHGIGTPRVVWGAPVTVCATTAALVVPAVATVVGRASSVTVRATRGGAAATGDFVVLLDGREVGSAADASSYDVALPAAQAAGRQVLTVAFVPADGSPLSTRSSVVTVAKAPTRTTLRVVRSTRARVRVTAPGTDLRPAGSVIVKVDGRTVTAKIRDGRATLGLGRLDPGRHRVRAAYLGSDSLARSRSTPVRVTAR